MLNELKIKYLYIYTEEKELGEYTTKIEFDDKNSISVNTKEGEEIDYLVNNLSSILDEYNLWIQDKEELKANDNIELEVEI